MLLDPLLGLVFLVETLGTLDGPPRVLAALAALEAGDTGQCVLIVSRGQDALYRHLVREFEGNEKVRVILDRRQGERRQAAAANTSDRRRVNRRSRPQVDAEMRSTGYAVVAEDYGG